MRFPIDPEDVIQRGYLVGTWVGGFLMAAWWDMVRRGAYTKLDVLALFLFSVSLFTLGSIFSVWVEKKWPW